ncbi:hypothetical protein CASFOL_030080 [Castilleja foliolosa]|uniref:Cytosine-specific methyltransferase n=1 Tax=Castilleja foliolosa TaxID=1961234 RepID=A0ABD3CBS7_9LAMI
MARKRKCTSPEKKGKAVEEKRKVKKRPTPKIESDGDSDGEENVEEFIGTGDYDSDENVEEVIETGDCESVAATARGRGKLKREVRRDEGDREEEVDSDSRFLGEPFPDEEAKKRWADRYQRKEPIYNEIVQAKCHYAQAEVDGQAYCLEDDASVESAPGIDSYICKIIEIFEAFDGSKYFTAQWYYRAADTVIGAKCGHLIDERRVFFSEVKDVNPLDCLIKKLRIVFLPQKDELDVDKVKSTCDFYFDKKYLIPYSSFVSLPSDTTTNSGESGSTISSDGDDLTMGSSDLEDHSGEKTLLDLYSGCGAMSTGLCLGANSCGVKLVTKWAVDNNKNACESLKLNHPETQVRFETAEDFLSLVKEWEKLCADLLLSDNNCSSSENGDLDDKKDEDDNGEEDGADADALDSGVFYVDKILSMCYGDPHNEGTSKLRFKVRWKKYGPKDDTWEPLEGLSDCQEKLKEFVLSGYNSKILPLPGSVDVICGGPPCQGISGYNRFRNKDAPLEDTKNQQLLVFMDTVKYLRPKFVLMENVVDILKFADGYLGRYALGSLVGMGYQARMGLMAAGAYGLPQFRMRMFMWGALSTEKLPQYPLPTHDAVNRGVIPTEFDSNNVKHEKGNEAQLKPALFLGDAISNLPHVENNEKRDQMAYTTEPQTEFQRFISLPKDDVSEHGLYDHRPLRLNEDDYERTCNIPKMKGANFRNLAGVRIRPDNKVELDPDVERPRVSSGKFLVPDYAITFVKGTSTKPFGRLWWDETVPTVVTRAEPHNQRILHPEQDRVLTVRENARLQGFPDYYKLLGPIKQRYIQVGNAVAVPVGRALGYSLALAFRGLSGDEPLLTLPEDYPMVNEVQSPSDGSDDVMIS